MRQLASLTCVFVAVAICSATAAPLFSPNSTTGWVPALPTGDDFISPESGAGPVVGELIRWVWNDGEVCYETRINGLEDHGGVAVAGILDDRRGIWRKKQPRQQGQALRQHRSR